MTYQAQINSVLDAISIFSDTEFLWFGGMEGDLPESIKKIIDNKTARTGLVSLIQRRLYTSFYCCGYPISQHQEFNRTGVNDQSEFIKALSLANVGQGAYTEGWTADSDSNSIDDVFVRRDGIKLRASAQSCLTINDSKIAKGDRLKVLFPKEQLGISPGYYMALSDVDCTFQAKLSRMRIYWNIIPEGSAKLIKQVTRRLNNLRIPFRFKVLNDPAKYSHRCDTAVLYLRQTDYLKARQAIREIYHQIAEYLLPGIPALTKLIVPGIGLAEDPEDGGSYGFNRCQILAEGIVRAYEMDLKDLSQRSQIVTECFAEQGIAIETPFLNSGSQDIYNFEITPLKIPKVTSRNLTPAASTSDTSIYLQAACAIANKLSETAYCYQGRCTWITQSLEAKNADHRWQNSHEMLSPTLYDGTAGIALFLSEVAAVTDDSGIKDLAFAALRQSLARIREVPKSCCIGLYSGWLGVALCAARIGVLHQQPIFIDDALKLVQEATQHLEGYSQFDIFNGLAGGILTLVALYKMLDQAICIELATQLGNKLIEIAQSDSYGSSWQAPHQPKHQSNLTGYSHGTAGVGHAFTELFAVTGEKKYQEIAKRAFDYESHWFVPQTGNWPDFRLDERNSYKKREREQHKCMCAWCHGAPGIALSRLAAYQKLSNNNYKEEAIIALKTTQKSVEKAIASGMGDYCLCHGLLGNAEILLQGSQVLKQKDLDFKHDNLVFDAANSVIQSIIFKSHQEQHLKLHESVSHKRLGLMIGLTGLGYSFLRLYNSEIPSILSVI